ncbi:hypothetical protein AK812_SmicGene19903 [Symbiodinium microadriaticum]|uniref:Uncharacterized protein n=1 Tax=Symbiodinium microadriaticum TaxID=2951 RepID=A0A1Q9DRE9_SYMMI|nr:hypothetical protein AK812_SmicGene19903 [Symbiodinium microadriaticum]
MEASYHPAVKLKSLENMEPAISFAHGGIEVGAFLVSPAMQGRHSATGVVDLSTMKFGLRFAFGLLGTAKAESRKSAPESLKCKRSLLSVESIFEASFCAEFRGEFPNMVMAKLPSPPETGRPVSRD